MALNYLMHENVGNPCTHYFDDYTIIVPEILGNQADELTGQFLKEFGWEVEREGQANLRHLHGLGGRL